MTSLMVNFVMPRLFRWFLVRTIQPQRLAILVKVIEDYCLAHDITDKTEQADTARLITILFFEADLRTAEKLREALHRRNATGKQNP
jgi:hypothetical protein